MSDKKIVKKEENKPCGCHIVEFTDGSTQIGPCTVCGLMEVARNLGQAAQVLGAVAMRIREEQQQQALIQATARSLRR